MAHGQQRKGKSSAHRLTRPGWRCVGNVARAVDMAGPLAGDAGGRPGSGAKGLLHCLSALGPEERPADLRVVVLQRYTFSRLSTAEVAYVVRWRLVAQP